MASMISSTMIARATIAVLISLLATVSIVAPDDSSSSDRSSSSASSGAFFNFSLSSVNRSEELLQKLSLRVFGDSFASKYLQPGFTFAVGKTNHKLRSVKQQTDVPHAFIATALAAWANHYGLELGPDDFWTAIAYGVSQHLGQNQSRAEEYRKTFVDHEGKKTLSVVVPTSVWSNPRADSNKAAWTRAIESMANQIATDSKTELASIITKPFSTSGSVEKTVFQATLMEAMKQYYDYQFNLICGIPEIVLHGTVQDYDDILDRLQKLKAIFVELSWWFEKISGHITKIRDTVSGGQIDLNWWKHIVFEDEVNNICARDQIVNGWVGDFVPYRCSNSYGGPGRENTVVCYTNDRGQTSLENFKKPALTLTEAVLNDDSGNPLANLTLAAGFVGIHQNKATKNVRPALGWLLFMKPLH